MDMMLYGSNGAPRDSVGTMSQAWMPAADQTIDSLRPSDDFTEADQQTGAHTAWTTYSDPTADCELSPDLQGGISSIAQRPCATPSTDRWIRW